MLSKLFRIVAILALLALAVAIFITDINDPASTPSNVPAATF
jgi:hypothetical protein